MKKAPTRAPDSPTLRQQAEQKLRQRPTLVDWPLSETDARSLVHELQVHQIQLEIQNEELTRFNRGMVGRELRMVDLKREINELCRQAGQPPRYTLDFEKDPPA